MKHSFIHKIKLFFLRFLWWAKIIECSMLYSEKIKNYKQFNELRKYTYDKFIKEQRKNRSSKETYILQGKVEILEELVNYVSKRE